MGSSPDSHRVLEPTPDKGGLIYPEENLLNRFFFLPFLMNMRVCNMLIASLVEKPDLRHDRKT